MDGGLAVAEGHVVAQRDLAFARALAHPMRIRILMAMNAPKREISPKNFCDETGEDLGNASYHFKKLEKFNCIELTRTQPRRGATEHFYRPIKTALAWTDEAKLLPEGVLDRMSATVLRGAVEEIGKAIDSGNFSEREDRALAWNKMWVDEDAWIELTALFSSTLVKALEIEEMCEARRAGGVEGFHASYVLAAFVSPDPPKHDG